MIQLTSCYLAGLLLLLLLHRPLLLLLHRPLLFVWRPAITNTPAQLLTLAACPWRRRHSIGIAVWMGRRRRAPASSSCSRCRSSGRLLTLLLIYCQLPLILPGNVADE